tara:strand:- start:9758 stop:13072 length:3315 start_codon:yes stop_codon:yes gene_type:complete
MDLIKKYINQYRFIASNKMLLQNIFILISILLSLLLLISIIEEIFYLSSDNRRNYIILLLTISLSSILFIIINWIINYFGLLNNNTDKKIAHEIGYKTPIIKDRLLNIIELYEINPKLDLTKLAIKNIEKELKGISINHIIHKFPKNELYILITSIILFLSITYITNINKSINRLINYNTVFNPPTPFKIINMTNDNNALSGDTVNLKFDIIGSYPDSIKLYLKIEDNIKIKNIKNVNNKFIYNINNIKSDITYWTKYQSYSIFSKWDSIGTKPEVISTQKRPIITDENFIIIPPGYTKEPIKKYQNQSLTQFEVLNNSEIKFNFKVNKELSKAWMVLNDERIDLNINYKTINGQFKINNNKKLKIFCLDKTSIANLNPVQYTFLNIKDSPASIIVNKPDKQIEINESYKIYNNLNINDNYGLNDVWIEYKIISPGFEDESSISTLSLNDKFIKGSNEVNIIYNWDIDNLGLFMGDEIHFWFLAKDNNPNNLIPTKTDVFIGEFPSLEDLFTDIETYEKESENWLDEIKKSIEEISDITEEVELELLKQNNLDFESEKKIEESFQKVEEITQEIEKLQKNIEKIIEQAEENNLFDQNLLEKFNDFQTMLQNIMTPEMMDAMAKLQDALKNIDSESIAKALENFEFNVEEFENQLDQFIDMFKLAQAEQALNELSKMAENLIKKQSDLIDELNSKPLEQSLLNSKSIKQEERFNNLQNTINDAMEMVKDISNETNTKLDNLKNSESTQNTEQLMQETTQMINNKDINQAVSQSDITKNNLEDIANEINNIKESFIKENMKKINEDFIMIINNMLTISNQQEYLISESYGIRSNSPEIRKINKKQNNINIELNQIMGHLIELSNQTFFIDSSINRAFGRISSSITKTISNFEQKKINSALKFQKNSLENINLAILLLLESMKEMNESNSPSGFEQFMEQMENMSQKQQGLNQATMQLNQLGMMQQQGLLGELLSQQQELKEQLDDLLDEFPGQNNGTMEKIGEDMDEIINDFKNKRINRETIERQEQILSRMLDNQKSLTKKDYSNKRKSKTGNDFMYDGDTSLDLESIDKNYLIINAMESAMDEGYSNEYNKIIRNYFLNLQNDE